MATKSLRSSGTQLTQRGVNQGNVLVDPISGLPVDVRVDSDGARRLAVDANLTADEIIVQTDDLTADKDAVRIEDPITGAHVKVNADGSINANIVVSSSGNVKSLFNDITSIASGSSSTILTYTVPVGKSAFLQRISVGGTNIATYDIKYNGAKFDRIRTYFGDSLTIESDYSSSGVGVPLSAGDQISVIVTNFRPTSGDFESRIQVVEE